MPGCDVRRYRESETRKNCAHSRGGLACVGLYDRSNSTIPVQTPGGFESCVGGLGVRLALMKVFKHTKRDNHRYPSFCDLQY